MDVFTPKMVIVGSGVSGLAAAESLVKAGFQQVRVLEATKRSGGRVRTSTLGKWSSPETFSLCLTFKDFSPLNISAVCVSISAPLLDQVFAADVFDQV